MVLQSKQPKSRREREEKVASPRDARDMLHR